MDFSFQMVGAEAFFDGKLPASNKDAVEVAKRELYDERTDEDHSKGWVGPLVDLPTTREGVVFANQIYSYEPIAVTHRLYFAKYMKMTAKAQEGKVYHWTIETLQGLLEKHLRGSRNGVESSGQTEVYERDGDVPQSTLLRTLKETLQRESRVLHFDYLSFHVTCLKLFRTVRNDFRHRLEQVSLSVLQLRAALTRRMFDSTSHSFTGRRRAL